MPGTEALPCSGGYAAPHLHAWPPWSHQLLQTTPRTVPTNRIHERELRGGRGCLQESDPMRSHVQNLYREHPSPHLMSNDLSSSTGVGNAREICLPGKQRSLSALKLERGDMFQTRTVPCSRLHQRTVPHSRSRGVFRYYVTVHAKLCALPPDPCRWLTELRYHVNLEVARGQLVLTLILTVWWHFLLSPSRRRSQHLHCFASLPQPPVMTGCRSQQQDN